MKADRTIFAVCSAFLLLAGFVSLDTARAGDGDGSYWRGPTGKPPVEWSATKNVRWKVVLPGKGSASPIIWGDKIFIAASISKGAAKPG